MRRAQYTIAGAAGADAELTVFWFGVGQGGSIDDNLRRWHDQFTAEGSTAPTTTQRTVHNLRVHVTERRGRFAGMAMPGAPAPTAREDWALLGAIVETPDGPWFFKMTGPRATIESARRGFDDLVASFEMP
jgi:hypothetical protein